MYLSRLRFNPAVRQVQKELANRYELHRTLCAQFKSIQREEIGLLFRIEPSNPYEMNPITLLVQSKVEPCWDRLSDKGLLVDKAEVRQYEPIFHAGQELIFRLLANPTMRRNHGNWAGKRVGLLRTEEQENWLGRKGKQCGFDLIQADIRQIGKVSGSKIAAGQKQVLTYQAVLFEGLLKVNNPVAIEKAVEDGIGSAKAFGFGLLSLARL